MISLIVPPKDQISRLAKMLGIELIVDYMTEPLTTT